MKYGYCLGAAFLLNGLVSVGMKLVPEFGLEKSTPVVIASMYLTAAAAALLYLSANSSKPRKSDVLIGVATGISSVGGTGLAIYALFTLPGYVVFPLLAGGTILLVALAGRLIFHERIGPYGLAGIAAGILAIVLLSMPK